MRLARPLALLIALTGLLIAALPATAQTAAPPNPGDFIVNVQPPGGPTGQEPDCNPSLTTLPALFTSGQTSVKAICKDVGSATQKSATGSVSNPTLAASTGDTGFNTGTVSLLCDSNQTINFTLLITPTSSTMQSFGGTVFQACSFRLVFQDAQASALVGTIEANGRLGNANGEVVNNKIEIAFTAKVFVTGGTGAFAGYVGSGSFSQTETVDIGTQSNNQPTPAAPTAAELAICQLAGVPAASCNAQAVTAICSQALAGSPVKTACTAAGRKATVRQAATDTMKLALVKKPGTARILSPAPAAGRPNLAAKVKSTTRVRLTATRGAVCTVKANTGKVLGKGTAKGTYGTITIKPKAGSYKGAKSIQATCTTKEGKKVISNRVKVRLG